MAEEAENKEQEKPAEPASNGWQLIRFDALKNPPVWLAGSVYVFAGLLALAVLVLVAVGLFATFQIAYETIVGELKDRVEAAKVFFPILLALVGGPLLIWRVVTSHMQATAARHQVDVAREGLYTSLFTKAVEQLGATREVTETTKTGTGSREIITKTEANLEVRIGAIYALERIARDSKRDFISIIYVLNAYIQNEANTGSPLLLSNDKLPGSSEFKKWSNSMPRVREDIQTIISMMGQLPNDDEVTLLNLVSANLQRADLRDLKFTNIGSEYCHFDSVVLLGTKLAHSVLIGTSFRGAMFEGAELLGCAVFGANFSGAVGLSQEQINVTIGDSTTVIPAELVRPTHWPTSELSWEQRRKWTLEVAGSREPPKRPDWLPA